MLAAWHASFPLTLAETDILPLPSHRWERHLSTRHKAAFLSKLELKWPSWALHLACWLWALFLPSLLPHVWSPFALPGFWVLAVFSGWCCPSFFPSILCCLSGVPQQPWAGNPTLAPTGPWRNRTWMSKNQSLPGGNSYMTFIGKELCVDSWSVLPDWWPWVWVSSKVFSHPLPSRRAL